MRHFVLIVFIIAFSTLSRPAAAQSDALQRCWLGNDQDGIAACSDVLASRSVQGSELAEVFRQRGIRWRNLANYERAIADHTEALAADPKLVAAWNSRCWARGTGNLELKEGLADCTEALRLQPNTHYYLNSRALVHFRLGSFDEAIKDLNEALRIQPEHDHSFYLRGLVYRRTGNTAQANADIAAALRIRSDIAEVFAKFGL